MRPLPYLLLALSLAACLHGRPMGVTQVDDGAHDRNARMLAQSTMSGRRLLALVDAINAGDSTSILTFGQDHYSASALAETGGRARLLSRWLEVRETVGPLVIDTILPSSSTITTAWVRGSRSRAWLNLRVTVDSVPPHRILGIGLGRGLRPAHALSRTAKLPASQLAGAISTYLGELERADLFSGVVAVTGPQGMVFAKAYGVADRGTGRRMTLNTPFDIASIGKTFTAVAVGRLLEDGKLSLDDPLDRFLPELPASLRRITVGQLLEHSSGLGELGSGLDSALRRAQNVSEMLRLVTKDSSLAFAPGSSFQYSNRGYILLGAFIERASGMSYREFVSTTVFRAAGMATTTLDPSPPRERAHRYTHFATLRSPYRPGARVDFDPADDLAPGPHGGAYSTANDLAAFVRGLLNGTLLTTSTLRLLTASRPDYPWSKGFMVGGADRAFHFGHGGGTPGMNSVLRAYPGLGYTIVVLSNYDSGANIAAAYISELIEVTIGS